MNTDRHLKYIMTKFRFGVSELSVHYYRCGSHVGKDLKCPLCGQAKENEVHFVLCCPMLDDIRKQFIPKPDNFMCNMETNIYIYAGIVTQDTFSCCWQACGKIVEILSKGAHGRVLSVFLVRRRGK